MTVTETQIMLAAVCGIAGIFAAFMPIVGVTMSYISKERNGYDDTSVWMFLMWIMTYQFLVSVVFYWVLMLFDALIKIDSMTILGANGAFKLFWTVPVISSSPSVEAWTTAIVLIRDLLKMFNAFLPVLVILGAIIVGYWIAAKQTEQKGGGNDYFGYGIKMFVAAAIASIAYTGWARMASYTLQMPSDKGEISTIDDAARAWWRTAVGVKLNSGDSQSKIL